ncbi:carbohydrate ABC transporter permease [Paenibacillus sp. P26]|nr:carbohydrate ABC transporter permease [Paenibacillus sp. P26]
MLLGKEADRGLIFRLFMYLILIDTAFIYIKPIIYMITTMVKDANNLLDPAVIWVPRSLFWGHLQEAFRLLKYPTAFTISMTVSLSVAVLQVISCSIAGYAFARLDFPLKRFWFVCLIFTFVMPPQVTILPSILLFKNFGWINTYLPMIIPAVFGHGLKGALFVIIFRQFFSTLPKELEEAAKIDGASVFRVFFRVMLCRSRRRRSSSCSCSRSSGTGTTSTTRPCICSGRRRCRCRSRCHGLRHRWLQRRSSRARASSRSRSRWRLRSSSSCRCSSFTRSPSGGSWKASSVRDWWNRGARKPGLVPG